MTTDRQSFYSSYKSTIEGYLGDLAIFLFRRKLLVLLIAGTICAFFTNYLLELGSESSIEHYLNPDDPAFETYTQFQNQFAPDNQIIIAVKTDSLQDIIFLNKLSLLTRELESEVPYVSTTHSILSAPVFIPGFAGFSIALLNDELTEADPQIIESFFRKSNPTFAKLISEDQKLTLILVSLTCPSLEKSSTDILEGIFSDTTVKAAEDIEGENQTLCSLNPIQNKQMLTAVERVLKKHHTTGFETYLTGMPVLRGYLNTVMKEDTNKFMILSFAIISIGLFILFRSLAGLVIPILISLFTLITTMGAMALCNVPFQAPMRILPSFLIVVSISASVHILVIYFQNAGPSRAMCMEAIKKAYTHSGVPVILTSITTSAGLASFSSAQITPISDLGLFASTGVIASLVFTLFLIPPLLGLFPANSALKVPRMNPQAPKIMTVISFLARCSVSHGKIIILMSLALFSCSLYGLSNIKFVHNPLLRLPESAMLRVDTENISRHYDGLASIEIIINTHAPEGLTEPSTYQKIKSFSQDLSSLKTDKVYVFAVSSIFEFIDEIHTHYTDHATERYDVEPSSNRYAQEFLALENIFPRIVSSYSDAGLQTIRISVSVPWADALAYDPLISKIELLADQYFGDNYRVDITGIAPLLSRTIHATVESMTRSYLIALVVITILMIGLVGRLKVGLLSMFPNLLPIVVVLGIMGWLAIPMDMYALLVGSIAIGIVVDDTIHFVHSFHRSLTTSQHIEMAISEALSTSGMAMLLTSIVISSGSFIFMLSKMENLQIFGMLIGVIVILALLADFFLAPALLAFYYKNKVPKTDL